MKKYGIVLGSALLLLLSVSPHIRATEPESVKYPAPPGSEDVPDHLVWNEDTGGYYDPEEFEWDPANRVYKERFIIEDSPMPDDWTEPEDEWIRRHENSDDPVVQALIKFYYERRANLTFEERISSQFMTPTARKALRHLVELGPEYVDNMLRMIENGSLWSMVLTYAIQEIQGNASLEDQYFDPTPEGMKRWAETFRARTAGIE